MDLAEQLRRDEQCRLKPYRDSVGKLTIGWGRNLDDVGLSFAEAEVLFKHDLAKAQADVIARIPAAMALDEVRRGVLVNMTYNMGVGGLLTFKKMLAAVERADWAGAAREMLDSKWAGQVGHRAERLAEQMLSGEWR